MRLRSIGRSLRSRGVLDNGSIRVDCLIDMNTVRYGLAAHQILCIYKRIDVSMNMVSYDNSKI